MNAPLARGRRTKLSIFKGLMLSLAAVTGCDSAKNSAAACTTGELRCACYANNSCNVGLSCISDLCVESGGASGTGGGQGPTGGTAPAQGGAATGGASMANGGTSQQATGGESAGATGGAPQAQTGGASSGTPTGGSAPVATGGAAPSATGGNASVPATGGAGTGGSIANATGGATSVNNSPIIDAFASCDNQLESNGGRNGKWYSFADTDFNATSGFGDPGTKWADHGCAAWLILGCTGTACTYAGLGFQLLQGNPYDLSGYTGVSIALEAGNDIYFDVKTSDGGYFGTWIVATTGNQVRNVDFADLAEMANSATSTFNTKLITEMQFTIGKTLALNAGFGVAIHSVSLR